MRTLLMVITFIIAISGSSQAAMLTYLSGDLTAFVKNDVFGPGEDFDISHTGQNSIRADFTSSKSSLSAHAGITFLNPASGSSTINFYLLANGTYSDDYGSCSELTAFAGTTDFIFFKVEGTPGDHGKLYYEWSGWGGANCPSPGNIGSSRALTIMVNGVIETRGSGGAEHGIFNWEPPEEGTFGTVDVAIGDVVGIKIYSEVGILTEMGDGGQQIGCLIELQDFPCVPAPPVPLPSTPLLLGSGLLRLANYRRRKNSWVA